MGWLSMRVGEGLGGGVMLGMAEDKVLGMDEGIVLGMTLLVLSVATGLDISMGVRVTPVVVILGMVGTGWAETGWNRCRWRGTRLQTIDIAMVCMTGSKPS